MKLRDRITAARRDKDILLMTHIVLGYPSLEANREVIAAMVANGVDLIEMQIPFSEPVADGPVIARANQESINAGTRVEDCFAFAAETTRAHDIPFLFMTYYNIVFKHGEEAFFQRAADIGIQGLIVPDLPPEEGGTFLGLAQRHDVAPILIFAPTSTPERMRHLSSLGEGFIYCVARRGVTGSDTRFDQAFHDYMTRCRENSTLPLAVGFGIKAKTDIDALVGRADIAVIGSETIRLVDRDGPAAVGPFIKGLRS